MNLGVVATLFVIWALVGPTSISSFIKLPDLNDKWAKYENHARLDSVFALIVGYLGTYWKPELMPDFWYGLSLLLAGLSQGVLLWFWWKQRAE